MRKMKCAICGGDEKSEILFKESIDFNKVDKDTFSARRVPEKVHYQLLRCNNCRLIYSSPILSEDKIKLLYRESKMTYSEEIPSLKKTYGNYLKEALKYLPKNPKLLEVGGANGFFLEEAMQLGIKDVWAVEPSHEAIKQAPPDIQKRMIEDFFPSNKIKNHAFDIICVFQTLDHVIDPNGFLQSCLGALKRGGVLLCILHDTEGLSVKLLGESSPIFDIEHIYLFNKQNLAKIFEKNGFKTLDVFNVKNDYPLRYWIRMFPIPASFKSVIMGFLQLVKLDQVDISLRAGNIGIIAQK